MKASLRHGMEQTEASTHPPAWVRSLMDAPIEQPTEWGVAPTPHPRVIERGDFALTSLRINRAVSLDADAFRQCTVDAYRRLGAELSLLKAVHPIRLWNFIPGILEPLGNLPHRYMVFNQGRFAAYEQWHAEHSDYFGRIATASAVGHDGHTMEIHCLSCTHAGLPIENPRQVSAYCYSQRYGPLPPCFARAMLLVEGAAARRPMLLIGGTASVVGERSAHPLSLERQLRETCRNLRSLIAAGLLRARDGALPPPLGDPLDHLEHVRVYYVRRGDRSALEELSRGFFHQNSDVELVQAELCRPELLVEIEGLSVLPLMIPTSANEAANDHRITCLNGAAASGDHR